MLIKKNGGKIAVILLYTLLVFQIMTIVFSFFAAKEIFPIYYSFPLYIPHNENALCVYNNNSLISQQICEHYLLRRPGAQSLGLDIPDTIFLPRLPAEYDPTPVPYHREITMYNDFLSYVVNPVLAYAERHPEPIITHLAVAKDVPFRVYHRSIYEDRISGAHILSNPWRQWNYTSNTYSNFPSLYILYRSQFSSPNFFHPAYYINHSIPERNTRNSSLNYTIRFVTSYLIGYTLEDVKTMIDKATASAPKLSEVLWVVDRDDDNFSISEQVLTDTQKYLLNKGILNDRIYLERTDLQSFHPATIYPNGDVLSYTSPGYWHTNFNFQWIYLINLSTANRSIIISYESYNGLTYSGDMSHLYQPGAEQGKMADASSPNAFLGENYSHSFSASVGNVDEPLLSGIVSSEQLFASYASGLTFAESFLYNSLQPRNIPVGDPLMRISDAQGFPHSALCASDVECMSGNCDLDVFGVRRCHPSSSACITDATGLEIASGASFCTSLSSSEFTRCIDGQWIEDLCPNNFLCTPVYAPGLRYFSINASCDKLENGRKCSLDTECISSNCDPDISGVKRCHAIASSCVSDFTGFETLSGFFSCISDTDKAFCNNGIWTGAPTQCLEGCSNGFCVEDIFPNPSTLQLLNSLGIDHYLTVPINASNFSFPALFSNLQVDSDLYRLRDDGSLQQYFYIPGFNDGEWYIGGDGLTNSSQPENFIKPGEGFILKIYGDYLWQFSGEQFNIGIPVTLRSPIALIGIPSCGSNYTAADVISELNALHPECNIIVQGNQQRGQPYGWSSNLFASFTGVFKDFIIRPYEAYYVLCSDGVSFNWTPSCQHNGFLRNYTLGAFNIIINESSSLVFKAGKMLLSSEVLNPLSFINFSVQQANLLDSTSYIIIHNLSLNGQKRKTIYLEKKNNNSNGVCIADRENIYSENDILNDCQQLRCPGSLGNYTCTRINSTFAVSGLQHSGIVEYEVISSVTDGGNPGGSNPDGGGNGGGGSGGEIVGPANATKASRNITKPIILMNKTESDEGKTTNETIDEEGPGPNETARKKMVILIGIIIFIILGISAILYILFNFWKRQNSISYLNDEDTPNEKLV